jgi:glycerophosphoryl diester phosphodiesterase
LPHSIHNAAPIAKQRVTSRSRAAASFVARKKTNGGSMSRLKAALGAMLCLAATAALADRDNDHSRTNVQLGPRPFYLVDRMSPGPLKERLQKCESGPFKRSDFSIGHRGATQLFPEHTKESYEAAAVMGAGIVECDVTFTKDGHFVCRHAENDLHTTTNILVTPLAATCIRPFTPATFDANGMRVTPASAECRASALTLQEFRSLKGKMDTFNPSARTAQEFLGGTAPWRTDLYNVVVAQPNDGATLVTLRESIRLNKRNGVKHTPELKGGDAATIAQVFGSQERYAQELADVLQEEGVDPDDAWPQSFNVNDVLYWIARTRYGKQAVFLVDYDAASDNILLFDTNGKQLVGREDQLAFFRELRRRKVQIIAPAMPALLAVSGGRVVPSQLARDLSGLGFDIITWTFERSDLRQGSLGSRAGFYWDFDPTASVIKTDGDMYKALDVLAREVRILGIFSDWPATVTYYANCMGLK